MVEDRDLGDFVEFSGMIDNDQRLYSYLSTADICVCPDPKTAFNDKSTMNKVLEYMAFSKPIVAFDLKETIYSAQKAALYAENNNEKDFAAKIIELANDKTIRVKLGEFGRKRLEKKLTWAHSEKNLLEAYRYLTT
jgi:glycosyltransferase involved in cell wall biosynthesis